MVTPIVLPSTIREESVEIEFWLGYIVFRCLKRISFQIGEKNALSAITKKMKIKKIAQNGTLTNRRSAKTTAPLLQGPQSQGR